MTLKYENMKNSNIKAGWLGQFLGFNLVNWIPKIVMAPTMIVTLICMYGYMVWTAILSMTNSRMLPSYDFVGFTPI